MRGKGSGSVWIQGSGSVWIWGSGLGAHRWLSRAQLVGVDLDSRLYTKEVE